MPRSLPPSHLYAFIRLISRPLPTAVGLAGALVVAGACRTGDDARIVTRSERVVRSESASVLVSRERIPGGRPGGVGDPRRWQETPQSRRTVDPAGSYDLSFTDDGRPLTAKMVIEGTPGAFRGTIAAETRPEVKISTVTASGPQVTVTGDVPNGVLLLRFTMTGDSLRGDWSLRGDGGRLIGKHHPAQQKR